jgi:hypothetical protein
MIEIQGDFWDLKTQLNPDIIVFTSNRTLNSHRELVMGAGIALDFKRRYPNLPRVFGNALFNGPNERLIQIWSIVNDVSICAFPTKEHWRNPSILEYIERSCKELVEYVDIQYNKGKILMTRPGCGLGGLDWESQVKPICETYLDERFYICHQK